MNVTRTALIGATFTALLLATTACSGADAETTDASGAEKTEITIGFNPGPYQEMFEGGILPILEDEGYTVDTQDFTDGIVINVAVANGEIDANIMQHPVYLDFVNTQEGIDNAALVQIPTPRMALFGGKSTSLDDVKDGATITVPNSPSNLYRGLLVLRDVGWIDFEDVDDPNTADLSIITSNPKNLNITPIENAQQVPALQDVDYATIQGNFIVSGGLDYDDALAVEDQPIEFSNVVTVRADDLESDWALAIKDAYESPEFIEYIESNPQYDGYQLPSWFN
ncbi:D-methionine transport system substrate-binding protein [Microbacterium endophyticum]|uniref:D-methionine transport system substrate-binding protein n=1 Tax=Microbacterium endophyticum TaxID=1526412 RepID=A0A7W4YM93_9MICO|nr:MetQ/NlpA family ABC transporter substrate-binding protein [Microbacterium endophyticum]MBB2975279.1 D-methionine transport system substrate-binding protein [Microbacterium endophyticum]NIK35702.1 D-methionine transport system substrate-binding protein [Microbacterium endophyticum]